MQPRQQHGPLDRSTSRAALRIRALRGFTCTPSNLQNLVSSFQRCACVISRTIPHRMYRSISHARAYHHQNPKKPPLQPGRLGDILPDVHQRNRLVEAPSARTSPTPISLAIRPAHVHVQSQYPCSLWARTQCDGDGDPAMDGARSPTAVPPISVFVSAYPPSGRELA